MLFLPLILTNSFTTKFQPLEVCGFHVILLRILPQLRKLMMKSFLFLSSQFWLPEGCYFRVFRTNRKA